MKDASGFGGSELAIHNEALAIEPQLRTRTSARSVMTNPKGPETQMTGF